MRKLALFILTTVFFVTPTVLVYSQPTSTGAGVRSEFKKQTNAFRGESRAAREVRDPRVVAARIIQWALALVGMIALSYGIYGGYQVMTSAGNEEKIDTGKSTIITATLGVLIAVTSYSITSFVSNSVLRASNPQCDPRKEWCKGGEIDEGYTCNKYSVDKTGRSGTCVNKKSQCVNKGTLRTSLAKGGKKGVLNCAPSQFCCMGVSATDDGATGLEDESDWKKWGSGN